MGVPLRHHLAHPDNEQTKQKFAHLRKRSTPASEAQQLQAHIAEIQA
jgi:hypothetical protein